MTRRHLLRTVLATTVALVVLAGCSSTPAAAPAATPTAASSAASPSAKPTTVADVLAGICARHCAALNAAANQPACASTDCDAQVRQAILAVLAVQQEQGGNPQLGGTDLHNAITQADNAINDYDPTTCVAANTCGWDALTVKTAVGTVAIVLAQ